MGLFVDTANLKDIKTALSWGALEGVTTNPTIITKEKGKTIPTIKKILSLLPDKIFAQVKFDSVKKMTEEALNLHKIFPKKIIVKIPFCENGLKLVKILKKKGVKTCLTAIFSASQGFMAASAGADYLAVYVGRITRNGGDGIEVVRDLAEMLIVNDLPSRILAASIPEVKVAEELLMIEQTDVTAPMKILEKMIHHPLTDKAIKQFNV